MKIKTVIARESLFLLGIVILGLIVYFIGRNLNNAYLIQHQEAKFRIIRGMKYSLVGYTPYTSMMAIGSRIAIFGYPFTVFIRLIHWAIKTLKPPR